MKGKLGREQEEGGLELFTGSSQILLQVLLPFSPEFTTALRGWKTPPHPQHTHQGTTGREGVLGRMRVDLAHCPKRVAVQSGGTLASNSHMWTTQGPAAHSCLGYSVGVHKEQLYIPVIPGI